MVCVQAAFKRAPSASPAEAPSAVPESQAEDWEGVKAENKTLLHQVIQHTLGKEVCLTLTSMHHNPLCPMLVFINPVHIFT